MYRDLRDFRFSVSAFATIAWKSLNGKYTAKIDFQIGHFMLLSLTLTLEVLSLLTLFDKHLKLHAGKFEQNCRVRNIQNFSLFGKKKKNG